jgi:hypothetical protein
MKSRYVLRYLAIMIVGGVAVSGGCAPISSPPSMSDPGGVPVREVIQEIKCELMHAIATPMKMDDIKWFRDLTAKIDLTLNVSTLNQLTPTVVLINPLHNAYPNVGTSSLPGTALAAAKQQFAVGIGGGVSDARARAEDITFTVGFQNLRNDFRQLAKQDPEKYARCLDPNAELGYSNLDIKSWIDQRVLPLVASINGYQVLQPGGPTQIPGTQAKPVPTIPSRPGFFLAETAKPAADAAKGAEVQENYIQNEIVPLAQKIGGTCVDKIGKDASGASDAVLKATTEAANAVTAYQPLNINELRRATKAAIDAEKAANKFAIEAHDTMASKTCQPMAPAPRPPLDTISTSYTFTVAANIGVAPSWTLVRLTGPSGTGSAASTAGNWTNNLSVIIAPVGTPGIANQDVNYQRLIQALRPPPVPAVVAPF